MNAPIQRVEINGARHYETPAGILPSVTTILAATRIDGPQLARWKARATPEQLADAEVKRERGAERGTALHAEVESAHLVGLPPQPSPWMLSLANELGTFLRATDRRVEVPVWHETHGYAGTLDALGRVAGVGWVLWDWKSWEVAWNKPHKQKRSEWCEDYLLQARLYAKAAGRRLRIKVDQVRVAISICERGPDDSLRPIPAQVFAVSRGEPEYARLWRGAVDRLDAYYLAGL